MTLVCLEDFSNGNIHYKGGGKRPKYSQWLRNNVRENCYLKQVVIYVLRIWIIEGISQISVSCVRVVYLEVMGIRPNIHQMAQNWDAV